MSDDTTIRNSSLMRGGSVVSIWNSSGNRFLSVYFWNGVRFDGSWHQPNDSWQRTGMTFHRDGFLGIVMALSTWDYPVLQKSFHMIFNVCNDLTRYLR